MLWNSNFSPISLTDITARSDLPTGSSTAVLTLNGDVEISADTSTAARLLGPGGDILATEYSLEFDGNGVGATGAGPVAYTPYDSFLDSPVVVGHVIGDDDTSVTLYVRASVPAGDVPNAGTYGATQTLTAHWVGP